MSATTGHLVPGAPGRALLRLADRRQEHPLRHLQSFTGILQADAYSGYNELYDVSRAQGPITPALCWARPGGSFLSWRTSPPMRGATRMPQRSRRSPWRRSSASMGCSILIAASTAKAPKSVCECVKNKAPHL